MFVIGIITEATPWLKEEYDSSSLIDCGLITSRVDKFNSGNGLLTHDDVVIKWKHFPRDWPFVRGVNNREAGDLRRYRGHYDVIVMYLSQSYCPNLCTFSRSRNDMQTLSALLALCMGNHPVTSVFT